jgi:hypothetical protein
MITDKSRDYGKFAYGATRDSEKAYQNSFQKWQRSWERYINEGGENFEGDKAHSVAGVSEKKYKIVPKLSEQTAYIVRH